MVSQGAAGASQGDWCHRQRINQIASLTHGRLSQSINKYRFFVGFTDAATLTPHTQTVENSLIRIYNSD